MNKHLTFFLLFASLFSASLKAQTISKEFIDPPREFSVMPFWFWNDTLKADEIVRQIADFEEHGVYGFVIHPRMGLPIGMEFLDYEMLQLMEVAIKEAERRNMKVILYDEGSYPSGSCQGQVVAKNPEHAARGFARLPIEAGKEPKLEEGWQLYTKYVSKEGEHFAVVERPSVGRIRGLHWLDEEKEKEHLPPAGDILNPAAVTSFIDLVYDKFADNFSEYFGKTIIAVFTDEPEPMGRGPSRGMVDGNIKLMPQINEIIGYDFKPHFGDLWEENSKDWKKHREDYHRAIAICLEQNYYGRLSKWCEEHGIALTGHPAKSMDLGAQKYFHIPGQDLVWRYVEPGKTALEGEHSTMAKNASSAMAHLNRRRNSNELYGAYGHDLTYEEMVWLANWCFVRGQNLLYPHAFYYSVRGARYNERPPDVGPNAKWWPNYKEYADACRRLSWLNTDSEQVCQVAILGDANWLPYESAKVFFQHQIDFNYLDLAHLGREAVVKNGGISIAKMQYKTIVLDGLKHLPPNAVPILKELSEKGKLILFGDSPFANDFPKALIAKSNKELLSAAEGIAKRDLNLIPHSKNIRFRHVIKEGVHYYILFNEEKSKVKTQINVSAKGKSYWLDEHTSKASVADLNNQVEFEPYELKILMVE